MLQPDRLFWFWLADRWQVRDPDELAASMPLSMVQEWRGAFAAMGLGPEVDDIRHAELCHAASGGKAGADLFRHQPREIRPRPRPMTQAEINAAMRGQ